MLAQLGSARLGSARLEPDVSPPIVAPKHWSRLEGLGSGQLNWALWQPGLGFQSTLVPRVLNPHTSSQNLAFLQPWALACSSLAQGQGMSCGAGLTRGPLS